MVARAFSQVLPCWLPELLPGAHEIQHLATSHHLRAPHPTIPGLRTSSAI